MGSGRGNAQILLCVFGALGFGIRIYGQWPPDRGFQVGC